MIIWPSPPKAVKTAIAIQRSAFGTYAQVSAKLPRQRPARFVKVSIIGGSRVNPVTYRARIMVDLFGLDTETVESMHSTASWGFLNAQSTVVDGVFVRAWDDEQGPVDRPHPDILDMERWQFHGDLILSTTVPVNTPAGS